MVLSNLCNNDKMCEKKTTCINSLELYRKEILSYIIFSEKARYNFTKFIVILNVAPIVSYFVEQSFSVLQRPKTNL